MSSEPDSQEFVCKVLSTRARRKILDILLNEGPMELKEIAKRLGLREVTLRHHLMLMEQAGLITSFEVSGGAPGRPKRKYKVRKSAYLDASFPKRQYLLLSDHLIDTLIEMSGKEEAKRLLRLVGKRFGEEIVSNVRNRKERGKISVNDLKEYIIPALAELGSAPSLYTEESGVVGIKLSNCIFYELALKYPDVICEGHLSLFQVIADSLGGYKAHQETCMAKGDEFCLTIFLKDGGVKKRAHGNIRGKRGPRRKRN